MTNEKTRVTYDLDLEIKKLIRTLSFYMDTPQVELIRKWALAEAKKQKIDAVSNPIPRTSDTTVMNALKFLYSAKARVPLSPGIKRQIKHNLPCAVAWIHYHVVNSFGSFPVPGANKIKDIAFKMSSNELEATKEYIQYFRRNVSNIRELATDQTMFDLIAELKQRIKQE